MAACSHYLHVRCKHSLGRHQMESCPLCRAELPAGPKRIYETACAALLDHHRGRRRLTSKAHEEHLRSIKKAATAGNTSAMFFLGEVRTFESPPVTLAMAFMVTNLHTGSTLT